MPNAKFYSITHMVWNEILFSEFQGNCLGDQLRNQNGRILAFLNLHVGPGYFPPTLGSVQHMIWEVRLFAEIQDDWHGNLNGTILALKAPRRKMHLKMSSAEVICCK